MQEIVFGAGCFWGVQDAFDQIEGVTSTAVGYSGGQLDNPTYEDVCSGQTGHAEVVKVEYDEKKVSFEELLQTFWNIHDPTTLNRQGPDIGDQYRSVIYFHTPDQEKAAQSAKTALDESAVLRRQVATVIEEAPTFWRAEDYHQRYLEKNSAASCHLGGGGGGR